MPAHSLRRPAATDSGRILSRSIECAPRRRIGRSMVGCGHRSQDGGKCALISGWSRTIFSRQTASSRTTRLPSGSVVSPARASSATTAQHGHRPGCTALHAGFAPDAPSRLPPPEREASGSELPERQVAHIQTCGILRARVVVRGPSYEQAEGNRAEQEAARSRERQRGAPHTGERARDPSYGPAAVRERSPGEPPPRWPIGVALGWVHAARTAHPRSPTQPPRSSQARDRRHRLDRRDDHRRGQSHGDRRH